MNPDLAKMIRKSLAEEPEGVTHPSADLLAAFSEHRLTAGENERVAGHLALCQDCREMVYLASSADEQFTTETGRQYKAKWKPRPRWVSRLASTVFAVSALVIVAGIFLRIYVEHENSTHEAVQVARVTPKPVTPPQTSAEQALRAPEPGMSDLRVATPQKIQKPASERKAAPPDSGDVSHKNSEIVIAGAAPPPPNAMSKPDAKATQTEAENQPLATNKSGSSERARAGLQAQSAFAPHAKTSLAQSLASSDSQRALAFVRQAPVNETWRITPEGHLEHLSQAGWTGVLTEKPVKFRVVSQSTNGVWAGGSGGELFHSDDGEHWNEVALPTPADRKSDGIDAVHFTDLQHGMVLTQSGDRYITNDGGKDWQRE